MILASRIPLSILLATGALLAGCSKGSDPPLSAAAAPAEPAPVATTPAALPASPVTLTAAAHDIHGIAWRHASNDTDVDAAFAQAKVEAKPVFVYWGAAWCPPCNQVKATLFNRQDFIERSRGFVPVYVDGDSPGAQKLGARFKVSGYPTMVLFSPQGTELTRLPGEVDAARYTEVLTLGMNARKPVSEVLPKALAGGAGLTPNDWRLLAFYSWDTDQQQLVTKDGVPALLKKLAAACPADQAAISQRLNLKALAAADGKPADAPRAGQAMLLEVLGDEATSREQMDILTNYAPDITRSLSTKGTPQRRQLLDAFELALKRMEADATMSRADRLSALYSRVDLARIDEPKTGATAARAVPPKLPEALLADVRETAARDDSEITDGYERQSVITAAADTLEHAGLDAESDALLKANLTKSHSPYYLMSELAGNAKKRGDKAEALHWYEAAFDKSEGPATRLQWGAGYVNALVDLAPQDDARIEKAVTQLFTEARATPDAFYERSGRSLQRVGTKLQKWNQGGRHAAVMQRLADQLDGICAALGADDSTRASCESLLKPAAKKA